MAKSPAWADYDPALCTHRPSLLPIGLYGESLGLRSNGALTLRWGASCRRNSGEPYGLEEGEVVTRYPSVNQRMDHLQIPREKGHARGGKGGPRGPS